MVFMQFLLTSSAQYVGGAYQRNPVRVQVPLYGKYKTQILSVQYSGSVNTVLQIQSRQLAMPINGQDSANINTANRYPYILVGTENKSNPPIIGTAPWVFFTDWDGVFEYILLDEKTNLPLAIAPGELFFIINMDVEPVTTELADQTASSHMFSQLPHRTFAK